ncbi:MAG: patatin-like phospholipase family protein [Bryobacterales bacterium]|nr:patatin-like phospholipase family protein [Bryobacterales bacterium]
MRKILSIDGGGIRGIVPALVLAKIEQRTGKAISHLFDLVAGTSTGGILALALAKAGKDRQPRYSAGDLAALYENEGAIIFRKAAWRKFLPAGALFEERYGKAGIEDVLERYFGEARLNEALTEVLVTSYEIERRTPFFFRSSKARKDAGYDFPMKQAARATSAAPTYFEPLRIDTEGAKGYYALVDGGLYANNPAMCATVEARQLFPGEDLLVVSLGTGALTRPLPYRRARAWGLARWAKPVLDIVFDGVSSTVDFQLRQLLGKRYFRLQPKLDESLQEMDNASDSNIRKLKLLAEEVIREHAEGLDELCEMLLSAAYQPNAQ